jgi:hypothetical protein
MTRTEREIWIAFILEQRRHYLGIVAACDRMLEALKNPDTPIDAKGEVCYDDKSTVERVTPR